MESNKEDALSLSIVNLDCDVGDIFSLKLNQTQIDSIFDSIEKDFINDSIFGGVTKSFLNDFFNNIDKEAFIRDLEYSRDYEFNRYPSEYKSDTDCEDVITLHFFKDEGLYRLDITNSFYVEDFGCSEHGSYYTFRIVDNQVELIDIAHAG